MDSLPVALVLLVVAMAVILRWPGKWSIRLAVSGAAMLYLVVVALLHPERRWAVALVVLLGVAGVTRSRWTGPLGRSG